MKTPIKVKKTEKNTTLRLSESTKRELETFGNSGETHEKIIKKLMNIAKTSTLNPEQGIIRKGNVTGIEYTKKTQNFIIETEKNNYRIICTFNDLSQISLILRNYHLRRKFPNDWELNLEIINLDVNPKRNSLGEIIPEWTDPNKLLKKDKNEYLLLYLIAVKQVLEETFNLNLFEFNTEQDYFDTEKWRNIYIKNNLSMESYYNDVQNKIK